MNTLLPEINFPLRIEVPKPQPMTIAIGFICPEGLVVATDRRYSYTTTNSSLRDDGEKITIVDFKNGHAVVAEAGDVSMSAQFAEQFERMASEIEITSRYTVRDTATEAMRMVKRDYCAFNGITMAEFDEKLNREGTRAQCIIATMFEKKPLLYTIMLSKATAEPVKSQYITIGSGAPLAEYLLTIHYDPNRDDWFSGTLATYVIEQVKKHDLNCGGRPNVVSMFVDVDGETKAGTVKPEIIDQYIGVIEKYEESRNAKLQDGFIAAIATTVFGIGNPKIRKKAKKG